MRDEQRLQGIADLLLNDTSFGSDSDMETVRLRLNQGDLHRVPKQDSTYNARFLHDDKPDN